MPTVDVYTPRKVTPQNKDTLPSTHDQSKRISYMQVHIPEEEMAEAVRNYIRAQIPIQEGDEMPVVFIAGRGDNGHSAQITIQAATITVQSPRRPTDAVETFAEAEKTAQARNKAQGIVEVKEESTDENQKELPFDPQASDILVDDGDKTPTPDGKGDTPVEEIKSSPENESLSDVQDNRDGPTASTTRKASALFGNAPITPAADAPKGAKSSSIFSNIK